MNTPEVQLNETDLTFSAGDIAVGRSGVMAALPGGPFGRPDILITSWPQFQKVYGGLSAAYPAVLLCKRALERGSALRVSRMAHYTDLTDSTSVDGVKATLQTTERFLLDGPLVAGQTVTYTLMGNVITVNFANSSLETLKTLASRIKTEFNWAVQDAVATSATALYVVPLPGFGDINGVVTTGGSGVPPVVTTTNVLKAMTSAGDELFGLEAKYPGVECNNLKVSIKAPSNGSIYCFNLVIEMLGTAEVEEYKNIMIPAQWNAVDPPNTYLDEVANKSKWVNPVYSAIGALAYYPIVPMYISFTTGGGTNGSAALATDYMGDSAGKTGFYAFDGVDDIMQVAILDDISAMVGVHEAGAAYAAARGDLQYFAHLKGTTENQLVNARNALNINSAYTMFFGGGIRLIDPADGKDKVISELGDVLGIAAYSEQEVGPWFSFSGPNRGVIHNCLGSGNLFGAAGNRAGLNYLANNQINVVVDRNKKTQLHGSFTGQRDESQMSLANIRRFHIYLKKAMGPVMELFIEEPCDIITWKKIYLKVKPFLDNLVSQRAMFEWRWEGDQFANTLDDLKINNPDDVALGKYKARLFVKDIASLQEFAIDVTLTPSSVSFEDALSITNQ